jgi:hypothetical protein
MTTWQCREPEVVISEPELTGSAVSPAKIATMLTP